MHSFTMSSHALNEFETVGQLMKSDVKCVFENDVFPYFRLSCVLMH